MITVALLSVVAEEPAGWDRQGRPTYEPRLLNAGSADWAAISYLPQLALVVAEHRAGHAVIIPVEHVRHMTTDYSDRDLLGTLARVIP